LIPAHVPGLQNRASNTGPVSRITAGTFIAAMVGLRAQQSSEAPLCTTRGGPSSTTGGTTGSLMPLSIPSDVSRLIWQRSAWPRSALRTTYSPVVAPGIATPSRVQA
jgi:hypothetical protein